ncbi:hypothetical protein ABIB40_001398 [Pedobacter sp. UYP30]|uniref:AtpZ/AtpI family protein n=1 Tax=Pedobacter sp. UYP30 TaxID=1756400 RepID=UPI00339848ED
MENKKEEEQGKKMGNLAKFSAIGFQMIATIGLFTFIGYQIDEHRESRTPIITAGFALVGVAISLYQSIKQATKE